MKIADLSANPPMTVAVIILTGLLFWGFSCQPQTDSLLHPEKKITRPELQIELDTIIATANFRLADLDNQEQFRDIIFQNALLMIGGGAINPAGIITLLTGLYGITRGATDIKNRIKKKTLS